jgi:E3 ubiquitin-protein ligase RAD18
LRFDERLEQEYGLATTGDKATLEGRVQQWIILFNSNLDTSHPKSLSALRAKLVESESARRKDKDKGKEDAVQELGTVGGMAKYVKDKGVEFERLRREIMERDAKRGDGSGNGKGRETAIEVD